jgi:hypothetical protein
MRMNEQITVVEISTRLSQLTMTGAAAGRRAFAHVAQALTAHPVGGPIVLDFGAMDVVSGSALRELLVGVQQLPQCAGALLVLANLSEDNQAEAELVADATRLRFVTAGYASGELTGAKLLGPLDGKVARTLELVVRAGEADAQTVSKLADEPGVVTVWNNRLVALAAMGLLRERKVGKRKFYSPVIGDIAYGR